MSCPMSSLTLWKGSPLNRLLVFRRIAYIPLLGRGFFWRSLEDWNWLNYYPWDLDTMSYAELTAETDIELVQKKLDFLNARQDRLVEAVNSIGANMSWIIENV